MPTFCDEVSVKIENGRHPVVEQVLKDPFIANPVELNHNRHLLVITGPNMGGKSTYMRQTALITLLAYIGSFVPADSAGIGPIDRIFTRIGASDDLASGRSTFMVEMTANIFQPSKVSCNRSWHIHFDGACAEWLAKKIRSLTLFATHYFELTALPEQLEGIANIHLDALEHNNSIAFMHAVQDGAASKSYGLAVAALAGVPQSVIKLAKQKLTQLEKNSSYSAEQQIQALREANHNQGELFFEQETDALREAIEKLDPDDLSPKQALAYLYQLKKMVG
ncbi:MutS-related protein [Haemophilus influenzae]